MTNLYLLIHMPTYMHMPKMSVCTLSSSLYRGLFFLTLGRRVVVWTGNRSQRRGSQERKDNGRKTAKGTAMRAEATEMRLRLAVPPLLPHPHPIPFIQ